MSGNHSRNNRSNVLVDRLEARTFLSASGFGGFGGFGGFFGGRGGHTPAPQSAAVTADLALIKTDQAKLTAAIQAAAPQLKTDRQTLQTAVQTAEGTGGSANAQFLKLQGDEKALQTTIQADFAAILAAAHSTPQGDVAGAVAKLRSDFSSGRTTLQADGSALQTALAADSGVMAAKTALTTDSAPIVTAQGVLAADYSQLYKDLKAQASGGTTTTPTTTATA